jgi:hypothetical protein
MIVTGVGIVTVATAVVLAPARSASILEVGRSDSCAIQNSEVSDILEYERVTSTSVPGHRAAHAKASAKAREFPCACSFLQPSSFEASDLPIAVSRASA